MINRYVVVAEDLSAHLTELVHLVETYLSLRLRFTSQRLNLKFRVTERNHRFY